MTLPDDNLRPIVDLDPPSELDIPVDLDPPVDPATLPDLDPPAATADAPLDAPPPAAPAATPTASEMVVKLGPLAGLIDGPGIAAFDRRLDGWADRLRGNVLADRFFYGLSTVGDHGIIWHVIGLARVPVHAGTVRDAVELSSALGIEAAFVNGPVKWLFRRVRPVPATERPLHLRKPRTSSFPSGHASSGMFAAALVASGSRYRLPWYVLGGLVGWSRVHVKIHHPSDVAGGAVLGWLLGRLAVRVLDKPIR